MVRRHNCRCIVLLRDGEQIGVSPAEGAVRFLAGELVLFCKVKKYFTATGGFLENPC